jgi:hypothetical protein
VEIEVKAIFGWCTANERSQVLYRFPLDGRKEIHTQLQMLDKAINASRFMNTPDTCYVVESTPPWKLNKGK